MRDSQRQRVYDWETDLGFYDRSKHMSLADCTKLIGAAWRTYVAGREPPTVVAKAWRSRSISKSRQHLIILNARDMRAEIALHEVAHAIMSARMLTPDFASHGPYFVRLYVTLLQKYCGYSLDHLRSRALNLDVAVRLPFEPVDPSIPVPVTTPVVSPVPPVVSPVPQKETVMFLPGQRVRLNALARPKHMQGLEGTVVRKLYKKIEIRLDEYHQAGRKRGITVRASASLLEVVGQ